MVQLQHRVPACQESAAIDDLMAFDASGYVSTGADALKMNNLCFRLVINFLAQLAHAKGKISVLVVGGSVRLVKAAKTAPVTHADGKTGAGAIIDGTQIAVLRPVWIVAAPPIPGRSVLPDDGARFLQAAIRVHQASANETGVRANPKHVQQIVEPASGDLYIVVKQDQKFATRTLSTEPAAFDEAAVLAGPEKDRAADALERLAGRYRRSIVNHNDFYVVEPGARKDAVEAIEGVVVMAINRYHNRDAWQYVCATGGKQKFTDRNQCRRTF